MFYIVYKLVYKLYIKSNKFHLKYHFVKNISFQMLSNNPFINKIIEYYSTSIKTHFLNYIKLLKIRFKLRLKDLNQNLKDFKELLFYVFLNNIFLIPY